MHAAVIFNYLYIFSFSALVPIDSNGYFYVHLVLVLVSIWNIRDSQALAPISAVSTCRLCMRAYNFTPITFALLSTLPFCWRQVWPTSFLWVMVFPEMRASTVLLGDDFQQRILSLPSACLKKQSINMQHSLFLKATLFRMHYLWSLTFWKYSMMIINLLLKVVHLFFLTWYILFGRLWRALCFLINLFLLSLSRCHSA